MISGAKAIRDEEDLRAITDEKYGYLLLQKDSEQTWPTKPKVKTTKPIYDREPADYPSKILLDRHIAHRSTFWDPSLPHNCQRPRKKSPRFAARFSEEGIYNFLADGIKDNCALDLTKDLCLRLVDQTMWNIANPLAKDRSQKLDWKFMLLQLSQMNIPPM